MDAPPSAPRRPIQPLDDLTISRIAAGEVVESPASVVKELIENALDAGARRIAVAIEDGGRRRIEVGDDGMGIPAAEVETAFQRHATSKLRTSDDLAVVGTLGFRGEALAAIAAVAHVAMITRAATEPAGTRIALADGRLVARETIGAPVGTHVSVENLFHGVPARLAFLRGRAAEAARVTEVVARYSFAHPDRQLSLTRDGRTAFASPGTGDLRDALLAAYGHEVAAALLPLAVEHEGVAVAGFAGPAHVQRATRAAITLFINGRLIHDARLTYAITEAYHGLIPPRRFPVAAVLLSIAPERVDVNVHPAKTEVRLRDPGSAFSAVQRAVRAAVVGGSPVAPFEPGPEADRSRVWRPAWPSGGQGARGGVRERPAAYSGAGEPEAADGALVRPRPVDEAQAALPGASPRRSLPPLRVVGQLGQAFVVAEGPEGLYVIDQHAAHERVMYERMAALADSAPSQGLLAPAVVSVSPSHLAAAEAHAESLAAAGFDVAPFGEGALVVRAVPDVLAAERPEDALRDVLDALDEGGDRVARAAEERIVRAVCKRASVKAGQVLSHAEMAALLADLEACEVPHACPHGRPTMLILTREQLAQRFGR